MKLTIVLVIGLMCLSVPDALAVTSSLGPREKATLYAWLIQHPAFRLATPRDCNCDEDIRHMRTVGSYDGPVPDYEPYMLVGDFRSNGQLDFAAVVTRGGKQPEGILLIFDGPFPETGKRSAFRGKIGKLEFLAVVKSPKGPWPVVGRLESEGCVYRPRRNIYAMDCSY